MSGGLVDKVYIGLDNAPAAFDIKGRILGQNGTNLEYIRSETGVVAVLKTDKLEPLHLVLHHTRSEALAAARSLALNLIETIRAELAQWSAAQAGGPPPALNVPPPTLTTTSAPPPPVPPPPVASAAISTPPTLTSTSQTTVMPPVVSVAPATAPLMTVRQPAVLQLLPQQQQYVLNQENGQLIPIVQPGMQMSNTNFTSLPIAQPLGLQQSNFGPDTVQWTMPGSQTMLIPYQQLQDLTSHQGLTNLQPQQFVSIAPASGLQQTSLPLTAAQLQQLQTTGTIMHLNQKPLGSSGSLINIISTGQASSPQIISNTSTPTKSLNQDARGQKRLSDGTPSQLQLRPIAPAGSNVSQDKGNSREARSWTTAGAGRDAVSSMGMKINPHGTIIHVSSGQQTNVSATGMSQDGTGMYIRQIDRNSIQIQSKDQKQDLTKMQNTQNVQMITVPQGMTVLQNPLNISQMPTVLGQHNSQVYMIPTNQNLVQGGLPPGLISQQMLPGQNVTVMQPNQLGVPGGVQYNMPLMHTMNMPANSQYMPGINLNTQLSAQQLNAALAGHQLANPNLGSIPIVQAPQASSPLNSAQIPVSQAQVHQILQQNQFLTPTTQYASMPQQYMMPNNGGTITVPANQNIQYNMTATQNTTTSNNGNGQAAAADNETANGATNQTNYITSSSQDGNGYTIPSATVQNPAQNFATDGSTTQTNFTQQQSQPVTPSYGTGNGNTSNSGYSNQTTSQPPPSYPAAGSNQTGNNYGSTPPSSSQTTQQTFSPSTTPAPNQNYQTQSLPNMPNVAYPPNQNPYPNATGQNLAAYASNQYQYNSRPWFRPRYGSPQGSPYSSGAGPPPNGPPMPVPPPSGNYNYWQDS